MPQIESSLLNKPIFKIALILFFVNLFIYSLTLPHFNPSFADSDELITVAKIWGVAHPPGYPLYTLLAGSFGRLPIPFLEFAGRVNLLSVFLHSATVSIFFLASYLLLSNIFLKKKLVLLGSIFASFFLAFAYSFWFHSLIAEVFPLNSFFNALVILMLILWSKTENLVSKAKFILIAVFLYGLSVSNQQASLLLLPAYLFWFFSHQGRETLNFKLVFWSIVAGFLAFIVPYLYVFIAASQKPYLNWENVQDLNSLYRLITRAVYGETSAEGQAYLATSQIRLNQIFIQIAQFINYLKNNLDWIPFLCGLGGIFYLIRTRFYRVLIFLTLGLIGSGLFFAIWDPINFANMGNPDFSTAVLIMRRFYTFSLFFFAFFISFGIVSLLIYLDSHKNFLRWGVYAFIIVILVIGFNRFNQIKQNNFDIAHNYSKAFLGGLEKDGLLICITAENGCFQSYYLQQVENFRTDVVIIPGDFKQRSLSQLKNETPDLFQTTSTEQVPLIRDIIRLNIDKRPIYLMGVDTSVQWLSVLNIDGDPFYASPVGCGVVQITKTYDPKKNQDNCAELVDQVIKTPMSSTNFYRAIYGDIFSSDKYWNSLIYLTHDCVDQSKASLEKAILLNPEFAKVQAQLEKIKTDAPEKNQCPFNTEEVTIEDIQKKLADLGNEKAADIEGVQNIKQKKIYLTYQLTMLDPRNIDYRLQLAQTLANSGFAPVAKTEYQDILVLDPNNQTAKNFFNEYMPKN